MPTSFSGITRVAKRTRRVRLLTKPSSSRNHTRTVDARSTRLSQARIIVNRAVVLARLAVDTPVRRLMSKLVQRTRALVCVALDGRISAGVSTRATVLARARRTSTTDNLQASPASDSWIARVAVGTGRVRPPRLAHFRSNDLGTVHACFCPKTSH